MRIEALKYFVEVATCGSFTQAANNLFISQQGISRAIKALETEIGAELFLRDQGRIELTKPGSIMLPFAKDIIATERDMHIELMRKIEPNIISSQPAVIVSPFVSNVIFVNLSEELMDAGLNALRFSELNLYSILQQMHEGTLNDPAIVLTVEDELPCLLMSDSIEYTPWFAIDTVLICPSSFSIHSKKSVTVDEIKGLPLAYYKDPLIDRTIERLSRGASLDNIALRSSSIDMISNAVAQGSVCQITDSLSVFLQGMPSDAKMLRIEGAPALSLGLITPTTKPLSQEQIVSFQRFREVLEKACRSHIQNHPSNLSTKKRFEHLL